MAIFLSTLLDIAADNIPKTSPFPKRKAKAWSDEDCQAAERKEIKLIDWLINILVLQIPCEHAWFKPELKNLFKQKKRDSWKNYVSSVNVKKVWDMISKITGKNEASPMHHLKDENGTLITDRVQIANTLGVAIEKRSFSENYSKEFQYLKAQKEKQEINLKTNRNLHCNKKFPMRNL